MDGLTIRNSQRMLETGKTTSELRASDMSPATSTEGGKSFADTLKEAVGKVNTLQKESDQKSQDLAVGKTDNIPEVLIAAEKAELSLRLMTQVRNKIVEAYQDVMKMQV